MIHAVATPLLGQNHTVSRNLVWMMLLMNGLILLTSSLWPSAGVVILAMIVTALLIFYVPEFGVALVVNNLFLITMLFQSSQLSGGVAFTAQTICLLGLIFYFIRKPKESSVRWGIITATVLLLGLWLTIGYMYSTAQDYAATKIMRYFSFNIFHFFIPFFFWNDVRRLRRIYLFLFLLGLGIAIASFVIVFESGFRIEYRFTLSAVLNPIWYSRALGVAALSALFLADTARNTLRKLLAILSLPLFVFFMVLTASRAPLASLLGATALYIVFKKRRSVIMKWATTGLVFALVFIVIQSLSQYQIQARLAEPTVIDMSAALRLYFWYLASGLFMGSPLIGIGTGSFASMAQGVASYPHNIFLEIGSELGIIGLILFGLFVFKSIQYGRTIIKRENRYPQYEGLGRVTMSVFTFALINALFSGDITGNTMVWFSAGMIWTLYNMGENPGETNHRGADRS